jgi:hypothetical protein
MNRRNFFSLAALSAAAIVARKAAAFLKPTGYAPIAAPPVWPYPPPLTPEEKLQDNMLKGYYADAVRLPSHSHSINDPGHSHSINPNWIPCDKPMHYVHYTLK